MSTIRLPANDASLGIWTYLILLLVVGGLLLVTLEMSPLRDYSAPASTDSSVENVRARSAAELERVFAARGYTRLPAPGEAVPPVMVSSLPPDLATVGIEQRKSLFLRTLLPIALAENRRVTEQRALAGLVLESVPSQMDATLHHWFLGLNRDYLRTEQPALTEQTRLLRHMDEVPVALLLGQAILESGWGTSYAAQEGNSLFGQQLYSEEQNKNHTRHFLDLRTSVRAYVHNLNTHPAYLDFRQLRERMRAQGKPFDALQLVEHLEPYSEIGAHYVREVQRVIRSNELQKYEAVALAGR